MAKVLDESKLEFVSGNAAFTPKEFVAAVGPYFKDLSRVNRTNWLFAAVPADGSKPDVTGYRTDTTINVTINQRVLKHEKAGGKWAVYKLVE